MVKARLINGRHINFDRDFLKNFHNCPYVVGVDIFPVDNVPDDVIQYKKTMESLNFLLKVEASIPESEPYDENVLSLMHQIEITYGVSIDYRNRLRHEVKKIYDILCARYAYQNTKDVGCMMGLSAGWKGYRYERAVYETAVEMHFENIMMPVPAGYDLILRSCYGDDYMVPKNVGASHDYPFYKEQMQGLKYMMENEFDTQISDEQMEALIELKVLGE